MNETNNERREFHSKLNGILHIQYTIWVLFNPKLTSKLNNDN